MSVSLAHGYRVMIFTMCHDNRVGQLSSNWPTKQGGSRGNTGRTMGCGTIVAKKLIHILFPVCSGAQYFPRGLHKLFHFSIGFGPQRRHLSVLETEIPSKLCKFASIKRGAVIRFYHLRYPISSKYAVELRNHRFGRSRVGDLDLRKS